MNLSQMIQAQAHNLGFSLVGVATPDTLAHEDVFKLWLDQGQHGEMAYMNTTRSRESRAHPLKILPECRSVLIMGVQYPPPVISVPSLPSNFQGRVAAYAWGADYHDVLPSRLKGLIALIEEFTTHPVLHRYYTDTGPILERELAQRAGMGWIGKNTCLINPTHGSYYLLAEVLLGLELEPNDSFPYDRCGTCQRCISACPTHCILPDRTLDARRCISYLTIELKGTIPLDLRSKMGGWVFGCDICQQVCPWNRFVSRAADPEIFPATSQASPNLIEELALSPQEFNVRYRSSPLKRTKRRGFLRNIAVALGNTHNPDAVPALTQALLNEPEPLVRAHTAWALGQIPTKSSRRALDTALKSEADEAVKSEIINALSGC
jgi:epoxyqueuosine reductase